MDKLTPQVQREARRYFTSLAQPPKRNPGRPKTPDTLQENLILALRPDIRRKLANGLIQLAIDGYNDNIRLKATQYIFDRLEGRPYQAVVETHADDDPLIQILQGVMRGETPALPDAIEGGFLLLDAAESEAEENV